MHNCQTLQLLLVTKGEINIIVKFPFWTQEDYSVIFIKLEYTDFIHEQQLTSLDFFGKKGISPSDIPTLK